MIHWHLTVKGDRRVIYESYLSANPWMFIIRMIY